MSEKRNRTLWPALVGIAGLAAAASVAVWHFRAASFDAERLARVESENRTLKTQAENFARQLDGLRRGLPAPAQADLRDHREHGLSEPTLESTRLLIQTREKLAAADASIRQLESRIHELEAQVERVTDENKRLAAAESDLKETVATTNRVLEAVRTELKGKDERLSLVMVTNKQLQEENRKNAEKIAQLPRLMRDLEEVNRRRESQITAILRRYREITDQYRALADRPGEAAGSITTDMNRIGNALQMAEEDLRQLSTLNAQAGRIQQRLNGR
jgi:chromosome segregation ATPase